MNIIVNKITTAIACINTNRHFIGFETDKNYYEIALKRIEEAKRIKNSPKQQNLFEKGE